MMCPNCDAELKLSDRQGVEIDYCPKCRGVWLDRGELDKIIERSGSYSNAPRTERRDDDSDDDLRYDNDNRYYEKKKRKSFIEDLFDF
jgi:Zn-finger nucleic acid-binding protein